jgi:predicted PurR-regulated permease PerM
MKRSGQDSTFALPSRRVVLLLVLVAVLVWLARPVIGPFVVAVVIAYAFSPIVGAVQDRTGLPRALIALAGIVGAVVLVGLALWAFGGAVSRELDLLIRGGPDAVALLLRQVIGSDSIMIGTRTITLKELGDELQSALTGMLQSPGTALRYAEEVSTIALDSVLVLIVTFYLLVDGTRFRDVALRFLAPGDRARALGIVDRIHVVLGRWLRGQLLLVIFVAVLAFYTVLRQIEDQVIMPIVIGRAVHLHPVVTIFAVLVGLSTFGILGGLLAVPTAAAVNVALHEFYADELGPLEDEHTGEASGSAGAAAGAAPAAGAEQQPVPSPAARAPADPASG